MVVEIDYYSVFAAPILCGPERCPLLSSPQRRSVNDQTNQLAGNFLCCKSQLRGHTSKTSRIESEEPAIRRPYETDCHKPGQQVLFAVSCGTENKREQPIKRSKMTLLHIAIGSAQYLRARVVRTRVNTHFLVSTSDRHMRGASTPTQSEARKVGSFQFVAYRSWTAQ